MEWCRVSVVLRGPDQPDMDAVDVVARLALVARRAGAEFRLEAVAPELADLLALAGLGVDVGGQAEGGEEASGGHEVEEEGHLGDPAT